MINKHKIIRQATKPIQLIYQLFRSIKLSSKSHPSRQTADKNNADKGTTCSFAELVRLEDMSHSLLAERSAKFPQGFSGDFLSAFRGHGMEYHESRLYQYGDDIKNMDWRVTARTHKPFVKTFRDEKERPVFFLVDHSNSMHFATRNEYKSVKASKIAGLMAWAAANNGNKVGGLVFDNTSHYEIQPSLGDKGVLKLIKRLVIEKPADQQAYTYTNEGASLLDSLQRLKFLIRRGSQVFIISDFNQVKQNFDETFFELSRRGKINLVMVHDPIECAPLPQGRYRLSDGQNILELNHVNDQSRNKIAELFIQRNDCLKRVAKKYGMKATTISTEDNLKEIIQKNLIHFY